MIGKNKFNPGDMVIVTGTDNWWGRGLFFTIESVIRKGLYVTSEIGDGRSVLIEEELLALVKTAPKEELKPGDLTWFYMGGGEHGV